METRAHTLTEEAELIEITQQMLDRQPASLLENMTRANRKYIKQLLGTDEHHPGEQ